MVFLNFWITNLPSKISKPNRILLIICVIILFCGFTPEVDLYSNGLRSTNSHSIVVLKDNAGVRFAQIRETSSDQTWDLPV